MDRKEWDARIDAFVQEENRGRGRVLPVHRIFCQDGEDRSGGGIYNETVTIDTIGRFARALGDTNPLFSDPKYAAKSVYGGVIAPPLLECCICSTFLGKTFPRVRGLSVFDAGTKWERFVPIRPGDCFSASATFAGVEERTKAESPDRILLRSHEIDLWNGRGEHVSRLTARSILKCSFQGGSGQDGSEKPPAQTVPQEAGPAGGVSGRLPEKPAGSSEMKGKAPGMAEAEAASGRPHYTQAELQRVYENQEAQFLGRFRRGAQMRYMEDVQIGEELPEQIVGPYDESDGNSLLAAIGAANAFATKWGAGSGRRRGWPEDPETGARRLPIDRHSSDVLARAQGLPRAIAYGIHSQALLAKSVSDWMGDAGLLRSLDCRCRKPLFYGDLSIQRGRVTGKYERDGKYYAVLQLEAVRQDGVVHTEAQALVQLPGK